MSIVLYALAILGIATVSGLLLSLMLRDRRR